jgi:hypothetical protein
LSKLVLFGERALQRGVAEFVRHYHTERNHQGKGNALLFPSSNDERSNGSMRIQRRERLGGLPNYYLFARRMNKLTIRAYIVNLYIKGRPASPVGPRSRHCRSLSQACTTGIVAVPYRRPPLTVATGSSFRCSIRFSSGPSMEDASISKSPSRI